MINEASDGEAGVETAVVALPMARAATVNMRAVDSSVGIPSLERCPNRVAPIKQLAMKQERQCRREFLLSFHTLPERLR